MLSAHREQVVVPDVGGMTVLDGSRVAGEAGLALAQFDADLPSANAATWPHGARFVIVEQAPRAGSVASRWDSLAVRFAATDAGGLGGVREPLRPLPTKDPPSLAAFRSDVT